MFGVLDDVSRHNSSSSRCNRCPFNQFRAELMQHLIRTVDTGRTYLCLCNISVYTYMCMHLNHVLVSCFRSRVFVRWSRTEIWLGLIASICQYVLLLLLLLLFTFEIIIWLLLFIGAFAKLRTTNTSFVMFIFPFVRPPVRPHGTTRLPQCEFLHLMILDFSKTCRENLRMIKMWEE